MKLRNKKTGEIVSLQGELTFENKVRLLTHYDSLAELNDEWEDYEEPKDNNYWYIDDFGRIQFSSEALDEIGECPNNWMARKLFGNYFETKEEAEKAVEKLKAWKRLKDKGFRFNKWTIPEEPKTPHIKLVIEAEMDVPDSPYDLDLLFGGEE